MRKKPTLDEFRSGGTDSQAASTPTIKNERITKTIRLQKALDILLKKTALERSLTENTRFTESDIIELALKDYFNLND